MGLAKNIQIEREEAQYMVAEDDGRRCPYCATVIPYGTDEGPNRECPACVGALKDD